MKVKSDTFASKKFGLLVLEIAKSLELLSKSTNSLVIEKLLNEFEDYGFSLTVSEVGLVQQCEYYFEVYDLTLRLFDTLEIV